MSGYDPLEPREVPGHTKHVAGQVLADLASRVPADLAIVEVGVFQGRSACYLGAGAKAGHGAHVWGVDPWDLPGERYPYHWKAERPSRHAFTAPETREAAIRNVADAGLDDQVTLVRGFSSDVGRTWTGPPIGLLYIDGDHRADAVRADWAAWSPHLVAGATIAWDDHVNTCPDVKVVVAELANLGLISRPRQVTKRLATTRPLPQVPR